jgi:hypothetical protein
MIYELISREELQARRDARAQGAVLSAFPDPFGSSCSWAEFQVAAARAQFLTPAEEASLALWTALDAEAKQTERS